MATKKSVRKKTAKKAATKKLVKKKLIKKTKKPISKAKTRSRAHAQKPIQLYYWPTPNGWKISIMLEECGLPYKLKPVNIGAGDQFKPSFLKISPNNRMPAIIDPNGPSNKPIAIFESGAIMQYLGRKTGKFYPKEERARMEVDQWLFWQMGNLGPMAGQANHFRMYAPSIMNQEIPYAIDRYTNEVNRLFGVMEGRLAKHPYLGGKRYSIADMACWGWVLPHKRMGQEIDDFPHLKKWFELLSTRPALQRGFHLGAELRQELGAKTEEAKRARKVLFGQRAR